MKFLGKHFDEFAEVHTGIGNVVEDGFVAIALIFHVANFHIELQVFGNLSGANHRVLLAGLGFLVFLEVNGAGLAIDAPNFGARLEVGLLHLQGHQLAREGDDTNVVARRCFDGYHVADDEG